MNAQDVLRRYAEEELPEFVDIDLQDVNQRGNFGDMPIHVACTRGLMEEVDALLEGGADIDSKGEFENTPLHCAVAQNHELLVHHLVNVGANILVRNSDGKTAYDLAVSLRYGSIAQFLDSHKTREEKGYQRP